MLLKGPTWGVCMNPVCHATFENQAYTGPKTTSAWTHLQISLKSVLNLGQRLDLMIFQVFSNLRFYDSITASKKIDFY